MDLLDEFKNFCRDKGKYNIIDFKEFWNCIINLKKNEDKLIILIN